MNADTLVRARTGIHVATLAGNTIGLAVADIERIVVPLSGRFQVGPSRSLKRPACRHPLGRFSTGAGGPTFHAP